MVTGTNEILERGMNCLLEKLGTIETEQFISVILRERFDYTEWRRRYFDNVSADSFNEEAVRYARAHPFRRKEE